MYYIYIDTAGGIELLVLVLIGRKFEISDQILERSRLKLFGLQGHIIKRIKIESPYTITKIVVIGKLRKQMTLRINILHRCPTIVVFSN